MTVVYQGAHGFVTDLGSSLLVTMDDREPAFTLPRYGVWKLDSRRRPQVVYTTNNVNAAKMEADRR